MRQHDDPHPFPVLPYVIHEVARPPVDYHWIISLQLRRVCPELFDASVTGLALGSNLFTPGVYRLLRSLPTGAGWSAVEQGLVELYADDGGQRGPAV